MLGRLATATRVTPTAPTALTQVRVPCLDLAGEHRSHRRRARHLGPPTQQGGDQDGQRKPYPQLLGPEVVVIQSHAEGASQMEARL